MAASKGHCWACSRVFSSSKANRRRWQAALSRRRYFLVSAYPLRICLTLTAFFSLGQALPVNFHVKFLGRPQRFAKEVIATPAARQGRKATGLIFKDGWVASLVHSTCNLRILL